MSILSFLKKKYDRWRTNRIKSKLRKCGKGVRMFTPIYIAGPELVEIDDYVLIMPNPTILAYGCKFIVKKYAVISCNLTVVTSNHCPTVGVPFFFSNSIHINEILKGDIVVGEEAWLGVNVTLLPGAHLSRGCVVGANSLVNKKMPPYSVVVGNPARVIGTRFSKEEILEHESIIYPECERMSKSELDALFSIEYKDLKRTVGIDKLSEDDRVRFAKFVKQTDVNLHIVF